MKTEKIEQIRSSRPEVEVFCKKFHKIHRKTPVPESLFNKVTGFWRMTVSKHVPFIMIKIKNDFVFDVSTMQFYLCYLQQLGGVGVAAGHRMGNFTCRRT